MKRYIKCANSDIVKIARAIVEMWDETPDQDSYTNDEILKFVEGKGVYVPNEYALDEAYDLAFDIASGVHDQYEDDPIQTREEAYEWLTQNVEEHGNTYFWDDELTYRLNQLVKRFGNTYFWDK